MTKDPELKDKSTSISFERDSYNHFTEGLYILGLDEGQLNYYGNFFNNIYKQLENRHYKNNYQITRNALTMMKGAVFSLGTRRKQNPEWKEHCASSLREILHVWGVLENFNNDFVSIFKEDGEHLNESEKKDLKFFFHHYNYFSGIVHHSASGVLHPLRELLNNSNLKLEDCYKDKVFIDRVKEFFLKLSCIIEISKKKNK